MVWPACARTEAKLKFATGSVKADRPWLMLPLGFEVAGLDCEGLHSGARKADRAGDRRPWRSEVIQETGASPAAAHDAEAELSFWSWHIAGRRCGLKWCRPRGSLKTSGKTEAPMSMQRPSWMQGRASKRHREPFLFSQVRASRHAPSEGHDGTGLPERLVTAQKAVWRGCRPCKALLFRRLGSKACRTKLGPKSSLQRQSGAMRSAQRKRHERRLRQGRR